MKVLYNIFTALFVGIYRLSGGRLGGRMGRTKLLLLTTTGRKSGKRRTTPLGRFDQPGGYLIVASNGGAPANPAWYYNLKSNPHVTVQVDDQIIPATAELLAGADRAQAWRQVVTEAPAYGNYEQRTTREIPLILLRPDKKS